MGKDIHIILEINKNGKWQPIDENLERFDKNHLATQTT